MITDSDMFYPIEAVADIALDEQAKAHGELNDHVKRIEDLVGNILWERLVK